MRTLENCFSEDGFCRQNPTTKLVHYICVPAIYFSIVGLLPFVKLPFLELHIPATENLAFLVLLFVMIFYTSISVAMSLKMFVFSTIYLVLNNYISKYVLLEIFLISIYTISWIGQFYGHKLEGKKPSFYDDL